jgi:cytochrome c5
MRRIARALACCAPLVSCAAPAPSPAPYDSEAYLNDATYRRAMLEASIVNPDNGYSRLRLAHYATGSPDDWERLPEWNPAVAPIAAAELDSGDTAQAVVLSNPQSTLTLSATSSAPDDAALIALGRAAFERYPAQLAPYLRVALGSREAAQRYGLWIDPTRGVGGLVRAKMADGSTALAVTCSTCHAAQRPTEIENGPPNSALDLGRAMLDADATDADADSIAAWGPGRLDVTTATGTEPARFADLRPVRALTHLHADATLEMHGRTTLAIRIETLIITSHGQALRPPRVIALALAAYIETLADTLPSAAHAEALSPSGVRVFANACASCHIPPSLSGPPVGLAVIGTDPVLGLSAERGTSMYRVPSLHGVGSRGPLLHDASVQSLAALFDPARTTPHFVDGTRGGGAVPGHRYGLELSDADRAALLRYLEAL